MKTSNHNAAFEVRRRLIEVGGRTAQDLGLGRIVGQILVYLYLWDGACSLDQIEKDLGLSKAAVSIAARQLEGLGLLRRVWIKGDRKNYYRTADHFGDALKQGVLAMIRRKMDAAAGELDEACLLIEAHRQEAAGDADMEFLSARVKRAKVLRDRVAKLLKSPLLRFLAR